MIGSSRRRLPDGRAYHYSEAMTLLLGDSVADSGRDTIWADLAQNMVTTLSTAPADIVMLAVHTLAEDTITAGVVTRPMHVGFGAGEMYLATAPLAFPEEIGKNPVLLLPPTSVAQVSPSGLQIHTTSIPGVRVEQISAGIGGEFYRRMEEMLTGKRDNPVSIYDISAYSKWRELWQQPYVDCKFQSEQGGLLKPYAAAIYHTLWSFHKEGRLRSTLGTYKGMPMTRFWLE